MLIGAFMGLVGGVIVGAAGHPELGAPVGALLGWLVGIPVSIVVLRKVLLMRFSGVRVTLITPTAR